VRTVGEPDEGIGPGDVDDPTPTVLDHPRGRRLRQPERRVELHVEHPMPVLLGGIDERLARAKSCVDHEDVEPAEAFTRSADHFVHRVGGGDVADDRQRLDTP
jgi:hypothetical protein